MKIYRKVSTELLHSLVKRPTHDTEKIEKVVLPILEKVKRGGDKALKKFALEYDHVELNEIWVTKHEIEQASHKVDLHLRRAIEVAYQNIWSFHSAQKDHVVKMETMPGVWCTRKSVPLQRVGLYIPGGTAPLFSTVLMLGVPAKIAGCSEIIIASPTNKLGEINPVVLFTAHLLGIEKILKIGGAQAIAALAYGTQTVPKVDKIFGPGNQYVTIAKQLVARDTVSIDMPAGPSEVLVVADENADDDFIAADLLSQAEHGTDSQVVLLTHSYEKALNILKNLDSQLSALPRKDMATKALENSFCIVTETIQEMLKIINEYAPEHLIVNHEDAIEIVDGVYNAGSVFIGPYTPESAGDYASGTNHTLPTNGWAKSFSGVSLDSFVKKITYQEITPEGIKTIGPIIEAMAEAEHLYAHKFAVTVRLNSLANAKSK